MICINSSHEEDTDHILKRCILAEYRIFKQYNRVKGGVV
jgi:hypothetical protein